MADSRTSNVFKNSGAGLLNKLIHIVVQFAMRTAFIHILGNEYTGISGLFTDILNVLSLMELGLDSSMVYALYKPVAQKDARRIKALMRFYRKAFTIIGITVLAAGVLCTPFLGYIVKGVPNIKEDIRGIFLMYVATSSFSYFLIYRTLLLSAHQKSRVTAKWRMIFYVLESIIEIILLLIFRQYYAYLIVHFLATVVRNIVLTRIVNKTYPEYVKKSDVALTKEERNKLFRDIACLTVYSTAGVVIYSTDSMFISAFIGTVEVAIIGNFNLIINSVRNVVQQIVNAAKPSIGNLAATSNTKKQELIFHRINFIAFLVCCFSCTCLFTLLNPFIGEIWLNESYKISMTVIAVLMVNLFIAIMVYPVESFRTANGLFTQGWARPAIMAVINITLDYFMGREWGIIGILLATTISRLSTQAWFDPYLVFRLVFKKSVKRYYLTYLSYFCITAFCCAAAYFLGSVLTVGNPFVSFLIKAIIAVSIPMIVVIPLFRKTDDFAYLRNMILQMYHKLFKHHQKS